MTALKNRNLSASPRPEPRWLRERRAAAWQRFRKMTDPDFELGQGIAFDPSKIRLPYASRVASGQKPLIRSGIGGADMAALQRVLEAFPVDELDRVWSWHEATASNLRIIDSSKDRMAIQPIRLETKLKAGGTEQETVVVSAAPGSELVIIEHVSGNGDRVAATLVDAAANAKVTLISIRDLGRQSTEFVRRDARVGRGAQVVWLDCVLGGSFTTSSVTNRLAGRGARAVARTIFCGGDNAGFEIAQTALHQAGSTSSDLLARGVLDGAARSIYRGRISVGRGCQGCEAHQKEDTLLLGERAESSAVPVLEIEADDIDCGHGCTVGRLDRDQLFYLMSRGLDARAATKLLVDGFFQPIISGMQRYGLEEMVSCLIAGRLAPEQPQPCL